MAKTCDGQTDCDAFGLVGLTISRELNSSLVAINSVTPGSNEFNTTINGGTIPLFITIPGDPIYPATCYRATIKAYMVPYSDLGGISAIDACQAGDSTYLLVGTIDLGLSNIGQITPWTVNLPNGVMTEDQGRIQFVINSTYVGSRTLPDTSVEEKKYCFPATGQPSCTTLEALIVNTKVKFDATKIKLSNLSATVSGPTATENSGNFPVIPTSGTLHVSWGIIDPEGDLPLSYEVKLVDDDGLAIYQTVTDPTSGINVVKVGTIPSTAKGHTFTYAGLNPGQSYRIILSVWDASNSYYPIISSQSAITQKYIYCENNEETFEYHVVASVTDNELPAITSTTVQGSNVNLFSVSDPLEIIVNDNIADPYLINVSASDDESNSINYGITIYEDDVSDPLFEVIQQAGTSFLFIPNTIDTSKIYTIQTSVVDSGNPDSVFKQATGYFKFVYRNPDITGITIDDGTVQVLPELATDPEIYATSPVITISADIEKAVEDSQVKLELFTGEETSAFFSKTFDFSGIGLDVFTFDYHSVDSNVGGDLFSKISNNTKVRIEITISNVIDSVPVQGQSRTGWLVYRVGSLAIYSINGQLQEIAVTGGVASHALPIKIKEHDGLGRSLSQLYDGFPNVRIEWRLKKPNSNTPPDESQFRSIRNVLVSDQNSDVVNQTVNPNAQDYLNAYDTGRVIEWIVYEGIGNDPYDPSCTIFDSGEVLLTNTDPASLNSFITDFVGAGSGNTSAQVRVRFTYDDFEAESPRAVDIQIRDAETSPTDPPTYQERVLLTSLASLGNSIYEYIVPNTFSITSGTVYAVAISVTDGEALEPNIVDFGDDLNFSGPLYQIISGIPTLIEFTDMSPSSPKRIASFARAFATNLHTNPILSNLAIEGSICNATEDCSTSAESTCNLTNTRPTFTWDYEDENEPVSPQASFFVEIARNSAFSDLLVSQQVNSSAATFTPAIDLPDRTSLYVRIYATNSIGKQSGSTICVFRIHGSVPNYEIASTPVGSSNHTSTFFAKNRISTNGLADPSANSTITWTKDGEVIKTGSTNVPSNLFVSNFSAKDTGSVITFTVEDPDFGSLSSGNSIILSNQRMSNAIIDSNFVFSPVVEATNTTRIPLTGTRLATWTFNDPDEDSQYAFRFKAFLLGQESIPLFDSGYIYYAKPGDINNDNVVDQLDLDEVEDRLGYEFGDPEYLESCDLNRDGVIDSKDVSAMSLLLGNTYPSGGPIEYRIRFNVALPEGGTVYYKLELSDGEKLNPTSDDYPEVPGRVFVASTSNPILVNNRPVASNLRISGMPVGANCFVVKPDPVIAWNYSDVDGDIQANYELIVSTSMNIDEISAHVWTRSINSSETSVTYSGTALIDNTPYYVFLRVHDGIEYSNRLGGAFTKVEEIYSLFPSNPYHSMKIEVRTASTTQFPYVAGGLQIDWYVDGVLVKSGNTSDLNSLYINSKLPGDFNLDAEYTGSIIHVVVDGISSSSVTILNHRPEITFTSVTPIIPGLRPRVSKTPIITWGFEDEDGDSEVFFRVIVGTAPNDNDVYDSGPIFGNPGDINGDNVVDQVDVNIVTNLLGVTVGDPTYILAADCNRDGIIDQDDLDIVNDHLGRSYATPNHSHEIPLLNAGVTYYYTIQACDGECTEPGLPEAPDPYWSNKRVLVSASGSFVTNSKPQVQNVLIDGHIEEEAFNNKRPTFSWIYFDEESHQESYFRFRLYANSNLSGLLWDTGNISSTLNSVRYNYDEAGPALNYLSTYYFSILVNDGIEDSELYTGQVTLKKLGPNISICTVNDRVNPLNIRGQFPVFAWEVDDDGDGIDILSFEIRVSESNENIGTDSFVGDVWNTGQVSSENPFRATWNFDGNCFAGCTPDKDLVPSTTYYYQVRVYDELSQSSNWCYGLFRLNNAPLAIDLQVLPLSPKSSEDIEGFYRFLDDIGEKESNLTEIRWYRTRNNVELEVQELRNTRLVPSSYTENGDTWHFTVKPHDGTEYGELVRSPIVVVENKPPQITALPIQPSDPTASSELKATWLASDPDGDTLTFSVEWYKNGVVQPELRNSDIVPAGYLKAGDTWYYVVQPFDGTIYGAFSKSDEVTIRNTKPEILSITVDGDILPTSIKAKSPVIAWRYLDADLSPQHAFRVILGTRPIRTSGRLSETAPPQFGSRENGILYTFPDGDIITGNEVFDTGETTSATSSYTYKSGDPLEPVLLTVPNASRLFNYLVDQDLSTFILSPARTNGEITFDFNGKAGTYDIAIEYVQENRKSRFKVSIDGLPPDEITTDSAGAGTKIKKFAPVKLAIGSKITVTGIALEAGARAKFKRIILIPSTKLEILPSSMDLSGYVLQEDQTIKLQALSGTASVAFPYPSGQYDLELQYITELSGNPKLSLDVGNSRIINFVYESGLQNRTRYVSNVSINTGDVLKITATKNNGATARVVKIIVRPRQQSVSGYVLRPGIPYYASVKVYDGSTWSDWYTTKFFLDGSPWSNNVSNTNGWTIESRFRIVT